jgi:stringent starvation protein B
MDSLKPYLIRAVYDWIVDNELTPHLLVNADNNNNGFLPSDYIEDGKILLNIRPQAVEALSLGNQSIEFNTRFNGKSTPIEVNVSAVMAIYAKENGKGLVFDQDPDGGGDKPPEEYAASKPNLRVVK